MHIHVQIVPQTNKQTFNHICSPRIRFPYLYSTPRLGKRTFVRQKDRPGKDVQQIRDIKMYQRVKRVSRWKEYIEKLVNDENEKMDGWMDEG